MTIILQHIHLNVNIYHSIGGPGQEDNNMYWSYSSLRCFVHHCAV